VSYITTDSPISEPSHSHAWRADGGSIHATVRLSKVSSTFISFDSPADAHAVAAACTKAAEALERLEAEGDPDEPTTETRT
jgi:hypothetical protein